MSRLHTSWSRSLLREKREVKTTKESVDNKILIPTGGLDILQTFEVAKKVPVTIPGLFYQFEEKEGRRIRQRFYSRGGKIKLPNEDFKRDAVFDIEPRFHEGFIVPMNKSSQGDLVVEVPSTTNVFKFKYLHPETPDTSSVRVEFVITPDFVSFGGKKAVNPDAKEEPEEDESEDGESEEG